MLRVKNSKDKILAIGQYKILNVLYKDKNKDIYHVVDMKKPHLVLTLRILKLNQSPSQIDKEIEILNILNQYHEMLHFYNIQILSDKLIFLFDYTRGYNLKQIVNKDPKFLYKGKLLQFIVNMVYILVIYQKHNIIHNNINPSNIIFDGKRFHLIGLSNATIDLDNTIGNGNDIYSIGLVLFYIIFGKEYNNDIKIDKSIDEKIFYILERMLKENIEDRIKLHEIVDLLDK